MRKRVKHMWVDEEFCNMFKSKAAEEGKSIIEYSKHIAKQTKEDFTSERVKPKKIRRDWEWRW